MSKLLLILTFSLCFFQGALHAQSSVSYGYDAAGNRISRVITFASLRAAEGEEIVQQNAYSEVLKDIEIRIYPNPTEGLLKVELLNLQPEQSGAIYLYDLSGKLLLNKNKVTSFTELDIQDKKAGTYLLKIVVGDHQTEWKIIKK